MPPVPVAQPPAAHRTLSPLTRTTDLPLPAGEGRGEGERRRRFRANECRKTSSFSPSPLPSPAGRGKALDRQWCLRRRWAYFRMNHRATGPNDPTRRLAPSKTMGAMVPTVCHKTTTHKKVAYSFSFFISRMSRLISAIASSTASRVSPRQNHLKHFNVFKQKLETAPWRLPRLFLEGNFNLIGMVMYEWSLMTKPNTRPKTSSTREVTAPRLVL